MSENRPQQGIARIPTKPSVAEQIEALQFQMAELIVRSGASIRTKIHALVAECEEATSFPLTPGEKEEFRQIVKFLKGSIDRLNALESRKK